MFGWNAKISLASVAVLTRLTAAPGLLGWFMLVLADHNSQDPFAGDEAGDVATQEQETTSGPAVVGPAVVGPAVVGPAEVLLSFSTAGGWLTEAVPVAGIRLPEQAGASPGGLPQLPASGSQRAEEMGELLALRARVGTGLGDESEFRAALAALFEQEAESRREPAVIAAPAAAMPRPAEVVELADVPRSAGPWQPHVMPTGPQSPNWNHPGPGGPVTGPQGPAFHGQWNHQGPGARAGFQGPAFHGQDMPSEAAVARIRLAARAIEEAAWELEQVGEYALADDLRRQAQGIYLRARRSQSVARNRVMF